MAEKFATFHDPPAQILKITWSPVICMFFCPFILKSYGPVVDMLYEGRTHPGMDVNDPIAIYLAPSSLVYALLFAYMYDSAHAKWMETAQLLRQDLPVAVLPSAAISWEGNTCHHANVCLQRGNRRVYYRQEVTHLQHILILTAIYEAACRCA